jgi:hypothetical protein
MILPFSKLFFIINEKSAQTGRIFCFKVKFKLKKFAVKAGNFSVLNISSKKLKSEKLAFEAGNS